MRFMLSSKRRIAAALVLIVILCNSAALTRPNVVLASAVQSPVKTYLVKPSQGIAGKDHDLLISSLGCEGHYELANATLVALEGTPLSVAQIIDKADCTLRARIRMPADASVGRVTLWVQDGKEKLLRIVQFSIIDSVAPGQVAQSSLFVPSQSETTFLAP
jgi:hypothetical protein